MDVDPSEALVFGKIFRRLVIVCAARARRRRHGHVAHQRHENGTVVGGIGRIWTAHTVRRGSGAERCAEDNSIPRRSTSVSNTRPEIPLQHCFSGKNCLSRDGRALYRVLPTQEKERLVFLNRPAQRTAELVSL